jgi:hypothetical protein
MKEGRNAAGRGDRDVSDKEERENEGTRGERGKDGKATHCLDLIADQKDVVLLAESGDLGEIAIVRDEDPIRRSTEQARDVSISLSHIPPNEQLLPKEEERRLGFELTQPPPGSAPPRTRRSPCHAPRTPSPPPRRRCTGSPSTPRPPLAWQGRSDRRCRGRGQSLSGIRDRSTWRRWRGFGRGSCRRRRG